ncbi:Spy/CpxP family protein refolding chaperone [Maritalea sp.]|uniref:Spy/CpxP family protein refolding chaperone n=1 Tax=Maritalea sp. TaxID=2003361 RepID=UPI003EF1F938
MKKISALALAATLVGTMSISALAPAAYAQDSTKTGPSAEQKQERKGKGQFRPVRGGHAFLGSICSTDGAENVEKKLEIMAIRIDLTDAQRPAFDDLKTAALTAQTNFGESCAPLKAEKPEGAAEKMKHRTAMMELQLESMNIVMPAFESFYESLSDDQKAQMDKFGGKKGQKGKKGKRGQFGKSQKGDGPRGPQGNGAPAPSNG